MRAQEGAQNNSHGRLGASESGAESQGCCRREHSDLEETRALTTGNTANCQGNTMAHTALTRMLRSSPWIKPAPRGPTQQPPLPVAGPRLTPSALPQAPTPPRVLPDSLNLEPNALVS